MGRIMDSSEHARIVDYLMQYRGRIPGTQDLADKYAIAEKSRLLIQLDNLIKAIDRYAIIDDAGWIR